MVIHNWYIYINGCIKQEEMLITNRTRESLKGHDWKKKSILVVGQIKVAESYCKP